MAGASKYLHEEDMRLDSKLLSSEHGDSSFLKADEADEGHAATPQVKQGVKLSVERNLFDKGAIAVSTHRTIRKLSKREQKKFEKKRAFAAAGTIGIAGKKAARYLKGRAQDAAGALDQGNPDAEDDIKQKSNALLGNKAVKHHVAGKQSKRTKTQARKQARKDNRELHKATSRKSYAAKAATGAQGQEATGIGGRFSRAFARKKAEGAGIGIGGILLGFAGAAFALIAVGFIISIVLGIVNSDTGDWNLDGLNPDEKTIAIFFKGNGLTKLQTAAIMGNMKQESSCNPASTQVDGMVGGGIGLCQWGYGVDGGRGNAMENWARSVGGTWDNINIQLDWVWAEMCNSGRAADQTSWFNPFTSPVDMELFKAKTDIADATDFWQVWIEGAGDVRLEARVQNARNYLAIFNRGTSGTGNQAVIDAAFSQLGVPYAWGGTTPGVGLDCSGLTQYCYSQAGMVLGRTTYTQIGQCTRIDASQAVPGDLIFMEFSDPNTPEHVGIYIGDGQMIHEPEPGQSCKVSPVWASDAVYARLNS